MKKLFISVDFEGFSGTMTWDDVEVTLPQMKPFIQHAIQEINEVTDAVFEWGIHQVIVKDAHDTGFNLKNDQLHEGIKLINGWKNEPYCMFEGLETDAEGIVLLGYHCGATCNGNTLAHTLNPHVIKEMRINGEICSEFLMHFYIANELKIPILAVTGDRALLEQVGRISPQTHLIVEKEMIEAETIHYEPQTIYHQLCNAIKESLEQSFTFNPNPDHFNLEVIYHDQWLANKSGFFPGVKRIDPWTISYEAKDYQSILKCILFIC